MNECSLFSGNVTVDRVIEIEFMYDMLCLYKFLNVQLYLHFKMC